MHGFDWSDRNEGTCNGENQSPINLITPENAGFASAQILVVDSAKDKLKATFSNQKDRKVEWNGYTTEVDLDGWTINRLEKDLDDEYGSSVYYTGPQSFDAVSF